MRTDVISALIILLNLNLACSNSSTTTAIKAPAKHVKTDSSSTTVATASPTSDCDNSLWKEVYDPDRLQVLEKCKTVTGVIEESNADPDGDQHMLLKLDKGQKDLINKRNKKKKEGDLVVEVVCANNITRKRATGACTGYTNHITLPSVGEHVRVTGSYVLDSHNGWTEIHPVTRIDKLN